MRGALCGRCLLKPTGKRKQESVANGKRKLSFHEQRELDALPGKIEQLESCIAELHQGMAKPEFYQQPKDELAKAQATLKAKEAELEAAFETALARAERVKDLAREAEKRWLHQVRGKGIKVVSTLLRELPSTHNYRVVLVRRDLDEVLASQARMLARRGEEHGIDDAKMRQLFENDLWRAGYLLEHAGYFEHLVVDYAKVIEDPIGQARRIAGFFGGGLDVDAMADVVDARLYRNRAADT